VGLVGRDQPGRVAVAKRGERVTVPDLTLPAVAPQLDWVEAAGQPGEQPAQGELGQLGGLKVRRSRWRDGLRIASGTVRL